ncbi:unnamed protein product [Rotaria socialis]|uniref:Uncharacterized protein n=1 Tax=Rotaria socialis TaxID=392032 RepID=A0A820XAG4_9BILA|nr:unnamed protein product [Rotaria socialis]CAF3421373.1 unnamed protein product [Rotaria socialis]CAF4458908.1 unnamed protein product [Rotaria socialis]CAF4528853.1 unnamed protein product [Rotaria socialis]
MSQNSNNSYLFTLTTTSASFFTSVTSTTSSPLAITTSPSPSTLRLTSSPSPSPSSSSSSSNKVISSDNVSQIITWILNHISFYGLRVLLQLETQFPIIGSAASSSKRLDFFCDNDKYSL